MFFKIFVAIWIACGLFAVVLVKKFGFKIFSWGVYFSMKDWKADEITDSISGFILGPVSLFSCLFDKYFGDS
ncbi:MAG: hypothetical protein ABIG40_00370 [Parcubacteria group bacterium]